MKSSYFVIPAPAGTQKYLVLLDRRVKPGDDDKGELTFYEAIIYDGFEKSSISALRFTPRNFTYD